MPKINYTIKNLFKVVAGLAVTAAAFYFTAIALKDINIAKLLQSQINWCLILFSALLFMLSTYIRGLAYPFGIERRLTKNESWQIVAIGNAANMVLPFRAGEALRFVVFPKRFIISERAKLLMIPGVVDICFMLGISSAAVYVANFSMPWYIMTLKLVSYGFWAALALTLIVLLSFKKTRTLVFEYCNKETLNMIKWVGFSWCMMLISVFTVFVALGFRPHDGVILTFGAMGGLNIASMIPSSPGGIGIFEWSVMTGLLNSGVSEIKAQTAALVLHLVQYVAMIPLGIVLYLKFLVTKNSGRVIVYTHFHERRTTN